jgi:hypothetical protein
MTSEQQKAADAAVTAFIAARTSGVDEWHLIDMIFDASNEFTATEVKAGRYQQTLVESVLKRHSSSH